MSLIWAKLIAGIVFVLVPGFTLKENYRKHPYLTVVSLLLGLFLLFLSIKPLVEAADPERKNAASIKLEEIQKNIKKLEEQAKIRTTLDMEKEKLRLADLKKQEEEQRKIVLEENIISISNKKFDLLNETREVKKVRFSRSGKYILGAGYKKIRVWDLKTKKIKSTMTGHSGTVTSADFSPNDKYVVSGGYDGTVRLWNTLTGKLIKKIGEHDGYVEYVQFSDDGNYVISSGLDNAAKLWDVENKKLIKTFKKHEDWVDTVMFTTDNKKIVTGSRDKSMILWDIENENKIEKYKNFDGGYAEGATDRFDVDNKYIYGLNQKGLMSWEISTGKESLIIPSKDKLYSVAVSKNSKFLLTATRDKVIIYNLLTKEVIDSIQTNQNGEGCNWINSLAVSYDNKHIAVGGCDNKISVWDVQ